MTLNYTTNIISTYLDSFINSIIELDLYFKVILAIATLLGGFAAIHYFILYLRQREKIDPKLKEYLDTKFNSIKQPELAPLPVMDFVDGLPQLDDAKKRDTFENGMKLRDEHKPLEAIDRFRFLLSMNPSNEQKAALLILIGNSFLLTGNQDEALGHYKEALKAAENADSHSAKGVALGNIGLIYSAKGEADEALKYLQQALEIFKSIGAEHLVNQTTNIINKIINSDSFIQK